MDGLMRAEVFRRRVPCFAVLYRPCEFRERRDV